MNKAVAFTGHRSVPRNKEQNIRRRVGDEVVRLYGQGYRTFLCGMAVGFDMLAAEAVLLQKCFLPGISLVAVIPYVGQCERWTQAEQERYKRILARVDTVRILGERYFNGCLLRRNDYMVSHANRIIAYYDGKPKGGTFYTVRNATARGLTVLNLYDNSV